ncbi:glycosyltransferase [Rufibacter glacialis]|uniref:Glycosyltransferase n=1 Tax=Rufibacter glacialis TaxID=1259555 RepID=A0A5M8QS41_9BACT|nr:glycosyltransferase [Rufibacter glacialis]KAA6438051.1 glycosyltransferase [Rufibacter glacialis]GGK89535.1 glycosyl transferase [Rufibacter glacialis]
MAHIILVGPAYPFRGGIAASTESLALAWQRMGHQVEIFTFTTQYPAVLFPGKSQYVEGPPPQGLVIHRELSSINPLTWVSVGNKIRKKKPDLVLFRYWLPFMSPSLGTVARVIKRNRHTKVVALTDNIIPHEKRPGDKALTQYFVDACDAFVTMSATVTEELKQFNKTKPMACQAHPIYDTYGEKKTREEALRALHLPEGKYLLFFGFIRHYKGLDLLLQAMQDPRLQERGVKLIIAGEFYEPPETYLQIIEEGNLQERVIQATEYIPHEKVKDYFSVADLVVQPYRHASQSGVTQIAYHFEVPMIVTKVGGLVEMIPDQKVGYVVEVTPEAIANAIDKFYQEQRASSMIQNIKEEKKKYTWEALGDAITEAAGLKK